MKVGEGGRVLRYSQGRERGRGKAGNEGREREKKKERERERETWGVRCVCKSPPVQVTGWERDGEEGVDCVDGVDGGMGCGRSQSQSQSQTRQNGEEEGLGKEPQSRAWAVSRTLFLTLILTHFLGLALLETGRPCTNTSWTRS